MKILQQERENRRHRSFVRRFGIPTPPGTRPRAYRAQVTSVFVPMKRVPMEQWATDLLAFSSRLTGFMRRQWWNRK